MKQVIPYLVVSGITLVLAIQVVLVIYILKGDASVAAKVPPSTGNPQAVANVDSGMFSTDNLHVTKTDSLAVDSTVLTVAKDAEDSLRMMSEKLQEETAKAALLEQHLAAQTAASDSLHMRKIRNIAKMLETMKAEDAAKILQNLGTSEAKEVLMSVKKKQAGKILSALEPRYAARMMR